MNILNIVCIFLYLGRIWGQEQKYVVLAPKVFHIGISENVLVQVHGYTESFDVSLAIKSYPDKIFTYSRGLVYLSPENKFQGSTNLTVQPKDLPGGPNAVSHVYLEVTCAHFSKSTPIPLCYDNGFIFIQTDKSVYASDEPVKVRAYALDEDLKPSQREVTLTFIDPEGNENSIVGKNIYPGITTFHDFHMQPSNYGLWTIKAKYKEDFTTTGTAHFQMKTPDPRDPQINILLEPEDDFISYKNLEDFKITIRAGYYLNDYIAEADVFVFFGIRENLNDNGEDMMLAGTQITKVQVKNVVGHVVKGIAVTLKPQIAGQMIKIDLDKRRSETNSDGVASFAINIPSDVTILDIHVRTDDPELPEEYQASEDYQAVAYAGWSQSFLSLSLPESEKSLLVGEHLSITVTPKSPYADRITHYNYLISSRGKIRHFGTMKKLPGLPSQMLDLLVTQHMTPAACLLVYFFIREDQRTELVSDSVCLKVEEKCGNPLQIHLYPHRDSHSPNNTISLTLESQSEAWVALTIVNFAAYHFEERRENSMRRILQSAQKHDQDCGAGGSRNNAEGLYSTGLTVLTNMPAVNSPQDDGSFRKTLRSKRNLEVEIKKQASTFKHKSIQQCCFDGAYEREETCWERASRITIGPNCYRAFYICCNLANDLRSNRSFTPRDLEGIKGRPGPPPPAFNRLSENWLWKVYHVPKRYQVDLTFPDILTTWKIQGISISDKATVP